MQLRYTLLACSLVFLPAAPVFAQEEPPSGSQFQTGVAMTMYRVLTGGNGQEFYMNSYGQAIPLPGAGPADKESVAIYTGNGGESWYLDKNGQQVDLPEVPVPQEPPMQSPYWNTPEYEAQQAPPVAPAPASNPVIINNIPPSNNNSSGSSAGTTALAAGLGAAVGGLAGGAMDLAFGAIPYGVPVYGGWGGGGYPYYYGANGNRTYINNSSVTNNNTFNQWKNQNNWYHNQVNNNSGRYNHNYWPGKEHGFPQPGNQVPGRLYSGQGSGTWNHAGSASFSGHNWTGYDHGAYNRSSFSGFHGGESSFHGFSGGGHMFGGGHMGSMHFGGFGRR